MIRSRSRGFGTAFKIVAAGVLGWLAYLAEKGYPLARILDDPRLFDKMTPAGVVQDKAARTGGIDLNPVDKTLEIEGASPWVLRMDPAMLQQYESAAGLAPVILNSRPAQDIYVFLGITARSPR